MFWTFFVILRHGAKWVIHIVTGFLFWTFYLILFILSLDKFWNILETHGRFWFFLRNVVFYSLVGAEEGRLDFVHCSIRIGPHRLITFNPLQYFSRLWQLFIKGLRPRKLIFHSPVVNYISFDFCQISLYFHPVWWHWTLKSIKIII